MITHNVALETPFTSSVRNLIGRVEHYVGSTLTNTFDKDTSLQKIEISRVAENSRFFGMVICQRINIKLRDINREISISAGDKLIPYVGANNNYISFPTFTITEVHRNENTNQLSITGYDLIDKLKEHTVSELTLSTPYTVGEFMTAIATFAGTTYRIENVSDLYPFNLNYEEGANFDGTESIKDALQDVAEATQTIAFVKNNNQIVLKRLSPNETAVFTILKEQYISLSSKTNRKLVGICSATELGDNIAASLQQTGTTQYVNNNPFWDIREDIGDIVDNALAAVGGLTLNQFTCSWRGMPYLEIGDKIALITKDDETVYSYVLDDVITYDGGLTEKTQWDYADDDSSTTNPSSIGEMLKQTYARVDKQKRQIDLVASNVAANAYDISQIRITANEINQSVSSMRQSYEEEIDGIHSELQTIRDEVAMRMTDTQIEIAIREAIENGVSSVETETGFVFDKDGLRISKTGSEMTTLIDEDGMDITKSGQKVLTVDSNGVNAMNLTARQYLIIGTHSRFEDYGYDRTGCFWIG